MFLGGGLYTHGIHRQAEGIGQIHVTAAEMAGEAAAADAVAEVAVEAADAVAEGAGAEVVADVVADAE